MKKHPACEAAHTIATPVAFKTAPQRLADRATPVPCKRETSNEPQARW